MINTGAFALVAAIVFTLYLFKTMTASPIPKLSLQLSQTATSPPTIRVTVTNNNAGPVTILSYNSPLDDLALRVGLVTITPEGATQPLDLPLIKANRLWPPPKSALVGFAAGESHRSDIVLAGHGVPEGKLGKRASVKMAGTWHGVWAKDKDDVDGGGGDGYTGDFESNVLEIVAE